MRSIRGRIAAIGSVAVSLYSTVFATQILVWNPLAAMPGLSLDTILSEMSAAGEGMPVPSVIAGAATGAGLAVALGIVGVRQRWKPSTLVVSYLAVLAGGAPAYFWTSFAPGMSLADTFGIAGGDAAPGGAVLQLVSLVSVVALALVVLRRVFPTRVRSRRARVRRG